MISRTNIVFLIVGIGFGFLFARFLGTTSPSEIQQTQSTSVSKVADNNDVDGNPARAASAQIQKSTLPDSGGRSKTLEQSGRTDPHEDKATPRFGREENDNDKRSHAPSAIRKDRLESLGDVAEIDRFIEEVRQKNLFEELKSAKSFDRITENLNQLNGRFTGRVRFPEDDRKIWDMVLEASLRIEKGMLKGDSQIVISENGKVFSELSGNGDQAEHYRSINDGIGILVKASPDAYFQLYYLPKIDAFVGNYYRQVAPDQVLPKGRVRLERG